MQLVVDVGNTETVVGLASSPTELVADWRVSSNVSRTSDEMTALIRRRPSIPRVRLSIL